MCLDCRGGTAAQPCGGLAVQRAAISPQTRLPEHSSPKEDCWTTQVRATACLQTDVCFVLRLHVGIARVPRDYERMGHRKSGLNVTQHHRERGPRAHHTVIFTAEGSIYRKRWVSLSSSGRPPLQLVAS